MKTVVVDVVDDVGAAQGGTLVNMFVAIGASAIVGQRSALSAAARRAPVCTAGVEQTRQRRRRIIIQDAAVQAGRL